MNNNALNQFSDDEVLDRIIKLTEELSNFWSNSKGWAPKESSDILSKSRLDWQASLARMLRIFNSEGIKNEDGGLILAWTTLGSLTEGILKLFLAVFYKDYEKSVEKSTLREYLNRKDELIQPDGLILEKLRVFFDKIVFDENFNKTVINEGSELDIIKWILKIQQRRNAIHAFESREIGDFDEFYKELRNYLIVMRKLTQNFPYPDSVKEPSEI